MAAQVGTALLLCDEAGTSPVHRRALRDDQFVETVVTRAFSGRYARSLANAFTAAYSESAPRAILRSTRSPPRSGPPRWGAGDPQATSLWAGTGWRDIDTGPAADIVERLASG